MWGSVPKPTSIDPTKQASLRTYPAKKMVGLGLKADLDPPYKTSTSENLPLQVSFEEVE